MVTRIPVEKTAADTGELTEQIRALAYHLFESRGGSDGRDLDDWLEAERELILAPGSEVVQRDGKFEIRMPAEGYEPREIHVTALPGSLVVKAASERNAEQKILLRTIDLPEPVDADRTTATFDNGILYVTAIRQTREREPSAV
jgi:HSP20 family protein